MSQPYSYITTDRDAIEVCDYLAGETWLALDTETYPNGNPAPKALVAAGKAFTDPYSNNVRLVQLRSRDSESFLFDLMFLGEEGKQALKNLLMMDHITFILHNAKFDFKMLAVNLGVRLSHVWDTSIAGAVIGFAVGEGVYKQRGNRLKDLVRDYLDEYIDKTEQTSNWGARQLTETQLQYAADDLKYLFDLYDVLNRAIVDEYGMGDALQLEMDVLPWIADMELNGMPFDEKMFHRVQAAASAWIPTLEERICAFIDWPMIPIPPLLMMQQKRAGKVWRTKQPKPSTFDGGVKSPLDSNMFMLKALNNKGIPVENLQSNHLAELADAYPILNDIILYKDLTKQLSTPYIDWVHPVTGNIHPELNQIGAGTGRFTSSNPNIQQVSKYDIEVPEDLVDDYLRSFVDGDGKPLYFDEKKGKWYLNYRYCFVAPEGEVMSSADFSGQEVAAMVTLSGDPILIETLNEPEYVEREGKLVKNMAADIHARTAELMWGPTHGVTCWTAKEKPFPGMPGKKFRDVAKVIVFGLAYGKSAAGMAKDWKISKDEAQAIIDKFFENYRTLKKWLERKGNEGDKTRLAIYGLEGTSMIRLRNLNSGKHSDAGALKRAGMNTPIQGISALMMKKTICYVGELLKAYPDAKLRATIHDELLVTFPGDWKLGKKDPRVAEVVDVIDRGMKMGSNFFLRGIVPDKCGVGVGRSWTKD